MVWIYDLNLPEFPEWWLVILLKELLTHWLIQELLIHHPMASTSTSTMESLFKFRGVKIFYENAVFSFGNSWPYEDNLLCEKSNIKEKRKKRHYSFHYDLPGMPKGSACTNKSINAVELYMFLLFSESSIANLNSD